MAGFAACLLLREKKQSAAVSQAELDLSELSAPDFTTPSIEEVKEELKAEQIFLQRCLLEIFRSLKLDDSFSDLIFQEFSGSVRLLRTLCAKRDFVRVKQRGGDFFRERTSLPLMSFLAHMLNKCPQIFVFCYASQLITDELLRRLVNPLKFNTSLQVLNLSKNLITDEGARNLAEMLKKNRTLKCLFLAENKITSAGFQEIAGALFKNSTLRILDLEKNQITSDGLASFCLLLCRYKKKFLLELKLAGNLIPEKKLSHLEKLLASFSLGEKVIPKRRSLEEGAVVIKAKSAIIFRTHEGIGRGLVVPDFVGRKAVGAGCGSSDTDDEDECLYGDK